MSSLKKILSALVLALNTLVVSCCMVPFALLKLLLPVRAVRIPCDRALMHIAGLWVGVNGSWFEAINGTRWQVDVPAGLRRDGWYLVLSNHQSWVDILVLQQVFNHRIPFLKFFIKHELIYVPVIGLAWWALDFPFMKRKGGATAQQDLEAARKACAKFRLNPTSLISYAEGTRFTPAKQNEQQSPYRHLLKPKSGGVGIALETMGDKFTAVLDVTIAYPDGVPTFGDVMAGRFRSVSVRVHERLVPPEVQAAPGEPVQRIGLQRWVQRLWKEKDAELDALLQAEPHAAS